MNIESLNYSRIENLFSVKGKIVLITGAGGLGECFAKGFAVNGSVVLIASKTVSKCEKICDELRKDGYTSCEAFHLDVSDEKEVAKLCEDIVKKFGRIDVVVHTAALCRLHDTLADGNEDLFLQHFQVNMAGSRNVDRIFGNQMAKQGWGRIINVNTMSSLSVNSPDGFSYGVTKTGLRQITRYFAVAFAKTGVTVNEINPVWIHTPMMATRSEDYWNHCIDQTPMGRVAVPEDYMGIVLYMASEAGRYMTGQSVSVDGGWSVSRVFTFDQNK